MFADRRRKVILHPSKLPAQDRLEVLYMEVHLGAIIHLQGVLQPEHLKRRKRVGSALLLP
jgi:hypothetical protein